ncbi:hypothetical protein [Cellvibrio sp. PSBB006]|uniref:hypothetical protein n=1 Tax=Cellvibrio sp. PSBB006 TaxID=1987723 RepID=UPI000B3B2223|nr:hypothetical protein [Cellvibrio sp. PSBB006]ARU28976.1 hypothetical protein CBR65_16865 [Cellvibrio sp. PSBB006]
MSKKNFYSVVVLMFMLCGSAFSQGAQIDVAVDFSADTAEISLDNVVSPHEWSMSTKPEEFVILSMDGINIPVRIKTEEFILTGPKVGVFRFYNGKVSSVTRIQQNQIAPKTICTPPRCYHHSRPTHRPTLFVTIGGFSLERSGVAEWQNLFDSKLMALSANLPYKHFAVDWESSKQIGSQTVDVAEAIKQFISGQNDLWNVVLIGYSRGGIFAHDLSSRLAGVGNIKNLHVALLDPTAVPIFGDLYPTQNNLDMSGYLKFDGLPFSYVSASTVSDKTISGYNNYGLGEHKIVYCASCSNNSSHTKYAYDWVVNDFEQFSSQLLDINDKGSYILSEPSGMEVLTVSVSDIEVQLDASCTGGEEASCTLNGSITLGPLTTVSLRNVVSKTGIDVSVATGIASAAAIVRRDQIAIEQSDITSAQSVIVSSEGLQTEHDILFGSGEIRTKVDKYGGSVRIAVGGFNIFNESIGPLDAIIPGASKVKSLIEDLSDPFDFW